MYDIADHFSSKYEPNVHIKGDTIIYHTTDDWNLNDLDHFVAK